MKSLPNSNVVTQCSPCWNFINTFSRLLEAPCPWPWIISDARGVIAQWKINLFISRVPGKCETRRADPLVPSQELSPQVAQEHHVWALRTMPSIPSALLKAPKSIKASVCFFNLNHSGLKTAAGFLLLVFVSFWRRNCLPTRIWGKKSKAGARDASSLCPRPAECTQTIPCSCKPPQLRTSILCLIWSGCREKPLKLNCFPLHYEEE